jgi:hypothetical protein
MILAVGMAGRGWRWNVLSVDTPVSRRLVCPVAQQVRDIDRVRAATVPAPNADASNTAGQPGPAATLFGSSNTAWRNGAT